PGPFDEAFPLCLADVCPRLAAEVPHRGEARLQQLTHLSRAPERGHRLWYRHPVHQVVLRRTEEVQVRVHETRYDRRSRMRDHLGALRPLYIRAPSRGDYRALRLIHHHHPVLHRFLAVEQPTPEDQMTHEPLRARELS